MPLRLEVKKKLSTRTDRVKSVDFHPSVTWILSALYSGHLLIHNWEEQSVVHSIDVCPNTVIRCAKFVARKQWIVCGADDMAIRVFNYNSMEKVKQFDAHLDFIRHLTVHPSLPYLLSSSDDLSVRLWDWSNDWCKVASFEGHIHYVMMAQWNPKDSHIFATASLDKTIKVWGANLPASTAAAPATTGTVITQPHFSLVGHEKGVNCIEYYLRGEKPYLLSGSDDQTLRVWDYQTKQCVTVLTGHTGTLLSAIFHSNLPILLSGGEDGLVNIWRDTTYSLESTLKYSMGRVWAMASDVNSNAVGLATDEGTVVIKLGTERAVASMQGGKIILARGTEIKTVNLKLVEDSLYSDGERIIPLPQKDLGSCEVFPQSLAHHPSGRLMAVCGDGEYVIYTAQALRNKAYGKAMDFAWSSEGNYAVRSETGRITIFHNFKEKVNLMPDYVVVAMFGGRLLGIRSSDFVCFYEWENFKLIRRIDVSPDFVQWSEDGSQVVLACAESFFMLKYDAEASDSAVSSGNADTDEGVEAAFILEREVNEKIESGCWLYGHFAFTTARLRLQTIIAGLTDTIAFLDRPSWLLNYFPETNRLYLIDREYSVISYKLDLAFVEYQTSIIRRDFEAANKAFKRVPEHLHNKAARFLEINGFKEKALEVTRDLDHKFELARSLGQLELCVKVIREAQQKTPAAAAAAIYRNQWKQLGNLGLERGAIALALACFHEAGDLSGLLLLYSSLSDVHGLRLVASRAVETGKLNIAVISYLLLQDVDACIEVLLDADCIPEAAAFARSYCPSRISDIMKLWKQKLIEAKHEQVAESLADPKDHPELFPNLSEALKREAEFRQTVRTSIGARPEAPGETGTPSVSSSVSSHSPLVAVKPSLLNNVVGAALPSAPLPSCLSSSSSSSSESSFASRKSGSSPVPSKAVSQASPSLIQVSSSSSYSSRNSSRNSSRRSSKNISRSSSIMSPATPVPNKATDVDTGGEAESFIDINNDNSNDYNDNNKASLSYNLLEANAFLPAAAAAAIGHQDENNDANNDNAHSSPLHTFLEIQQQQQKKTAAVVGRQPQQHQHQQQQIRDLLIDDGDCE